MLRALYKVGKNVILTFCFIFFIGIVLFFLIGYYSAKSSCSNFNDQYLKLIRQDDPSQTKFLINEIKAENIRNHLHYLTLLPHVAGTERQKNISDYIFNFWKNQGFNDVIYKHFNILLSIPKSGNVSMFSIWNTASNSLVTKSQPIEKPLTLHDNSSDAMPPILAYLPGGSVKGKPVYANYGDEKDFRRLVEMGIHLNGTIALMRYGGKSGRGQKLVNAASFGCVGGLVYSDPKDNWAPPDRASEKTLYPNGWWLPGTGVQRGSAKMSSGDPATPDYPSTDYAYRLNVPDITNSGVFAKIPGYPIGYEDASRIFQRLAGSNIKEWIGGIANISYNIGPGFVDNDLELRLDVFQDYVNRTAHNVIATIRGEIEPDRYVVVGNHQDAWVNGAVDPSSGTATLLEYSRVLGLLLAKGWRPRRTILLCSWDAEEFGLIGSWEWLEEEIHRFKTNLVAYINIDIAVRGNFTIRPNGSPELRSVLVNVMKRIPDPNDDGKTLYAKWINGWGNFSTPISGSDYAAFIQKAGLPVVDISYIADPKLSSYYPLYHSRYETFYAMERFIDPGFKSHASACRFLAELIRQMADLYVLPFRNLALAEDVLNLVYKVGNLTEVKTNQFDLQAMSQALLKQTEIFVKVAKCLDNSIASVSLENPLLIRQLNDQQMHVMQGFVSSSGVPLDEINKNVLYSSQKSENSVIAGGFPGLSNLVNRARSLNSTAAWSRVRQHLSHLTFHTASARKSMQSNKVCWSLD